jgi:hypothetical protein
MSVPALDTDVVYPLLWDVWTLEWYVPHDDTLDDVTWCDFELTQTYVDA